MDIPQEKLQYLAERGVDLEDAEAVLAELAAQAKSEGRESKETAPESETKDVPTAEVEAKDADEVVEAEPVVTEPEPTPEPVTEPEPAPAPAFDMETVAAAIGEVITTQMEPIAARMDALEASLAAVKEAHAAEKAERELTPAASLAALIRPSVIGKEETRVDGRTSEAKDTPKETSPVESRTGIPFIDGMIAGRDWRDGLKGD